LTLPSGVAYRRRTMTHLAGYRYRGARALVLLHERELRAFLATFRRAQAWGVTLPETADPHYASLAALLRHVLGAAAGYLRWTTKVLELPDPGVDPVPPIEAIDAEAEAYLEHVLDRWWTPLHDVPEERFEVAFPSNWRTPYSVDAMLEHAVVHPMRHAFQLEELMGEGGREATR
jgi:hypothetical protein